MGIAPDRPEPDTAYVGTAGPTGVSQVQNETETKIKNGLRAPVDQAYADGRSNLVQNLFGGFGNGIAGLIAMLVAGVFGGIVGTVSDLIGGLLGVKNKANSASDKVDQVVDVELPRLDNRIDELAGGVTQFTYGTSGTFTKPAGATRIQVSLIGGGAGGSRYRFNCTGGGSGGWTDWYEFLAADVPSSVAITVGSGGAGATSDNTLGGDGQTSSFGSLLDVGPGQCTIAGPVAGYGTQLAYNGSGGYGGTNADGAHPSAENGGRGPFSPGGVVGGAAGSGADGGNGASPGAGLIGPGSGGAGGQRKNSTGDGGDGGHGGYPGGGGGGGGNWVNLGTQGNGGNGAPGLVVVRVYFN